MKAKLDINSFTANGKNYRASDTINLSVVEDFLTGKGYRVKSIGQPWRNVFAHLESPDGEFFFKLASTAGVGERLKNEIDWNTQMLRALRISGNKNFTIPSIFASGSYEDKPYYVSQYFLGKFIQQKVADTCENLESWLGRIVDCNLFFLSLKSDDFSLYRDKEFPSVTEYANSLVERIESWIGQIPERDLSRLRGIISTFKDSFVPGVNHGDFIPWHMIIQNDTFVLVDGEHGSAKTARYYDIAYFYHRVYTVLKNPDLAKRYLVILADRLDPEERVTFEHQFPKVLASRIIGGYFDAKHDGTSYDIHDRLHEDFLNDLYKI